MRARLLSARAASISRRLLTDGGAGAIPRPLAEQQSQTAVEQAHRVVREPAPSSSTSVVPLRIASSAPSSAITRSSSPEVWERRRGPPVNGGVCDG
jgi:hypothetical protein